MNIDGIRPNQPFHGFLPREMPTDRRSAPEKIAAADAEYHLKYEDNVNLTPTRAPEPGPAAGAADAANALQDASPQAGARPSVPVSLLADDFNFGVGSATAASGAHPTAGLGVLAQLDESAPVHGVRPIDGPSQPGPFSDLHLVGPSSAARFLANPNEMYLGG